MVLDSMDMDAKAVDMGLALVVKEICRGVA
jgi:hypothetical protein